MRPPSHLEPAERDPVAIRRTVLLLLLLVIGGILVANAYRKNLDRQDQEFRPPVKQGLIGSGNFQFVRQDRMAVSLEDLEGQVWLCALIATNQPERGKLGREIMLQMAKKYAETNKLRLVLLTMDPETDRPDVMAAFAQANGYSSDYWWMLGAGAEKTHKYVQAKMKYAQLPYEKEGEWIFDTSVMVVDDSLHIRGHFDFDKAVELDKEATDKGSPARYESELGSLLDKTVDYLIKNPL